MALFAVMVVFRDVVSEVLVARRERENTDKLIIQHAERIIAEAEAKAAAEEKAACAACVAAAPIKEEPAPVEVAVAPASVTVEAVEEEPEVVEAAEPEVAVELTEAVVEAVEEEAADPEGTISFATGQQQTLEEKYLALTSEQKGWYDEIIKYATLVEGSKRFKNARYEEYKVGKNRLVRMLIKRGVINCEFILHNSDFKNYISENKIAVKQSATTMLVDSAATVDAVKNSIDIVVAAIAEEKEYKKNLAKEKRRAARATKAAEATEEKVAATV